MEKQRPKPSTKDSSDVERDYKFKGENVRILGARSINSTTIEIRCDMPPSKCQAKRDGKEPRGRIIINKDGKYVLPAGWGYFVTYTPIGGGGRETEISLCLCPYCSQKLAQDRGMTDSKGSA